MTSELDDTVPSGGEGTDTDLELGARIGSYVIARRLGRGGQGQVYEAEDGDGHKFALKVLSRELAKDPVVIARLEREAEIASKVDHPNVVRIYGIERSDERPFLRMELLDGRPLNALVKEGPLDVARACSIACDVARGLGALHQRGIVHRDVKPANVFVCTQGRVEVAKLMDFGIAKARPSWDLTSLTMTGMIVGTPAYVSPEQVLTPEEIDHRSDIYSLGLVLFELLTGRRPFPGKEPAQLIVHHARTKPPSPAQLRPDLSPELAGVVLQCLAKQPSERPSSTLAFIDRIEGARDPRRVTVTPPRPHLSAPRSEPRRSRTPILFGGAMAIGVVVWAAALTMAPKEEPVPLEASPPEAPLEPRAVEAPPIAEPPRPPIDPLSVVRVDPPPPIVPVRPPPLEVEDESRSRRPAEPDDPRALYAKLDRKLRFEVDRRGLLLRDLPLVSEQLGSEWVEWSRTEPPPTDEIRFNYDQLVEELRAQKISRRILEAKLDRTLDVLRKLEMAEAKTFERRYLELRDRAHLAQSETDREALARRISELEVEARRAVP